MPHSAAVLGDPVEHSLSPVLHNAGYAAAGLEGWTYGRLRCPEGRLAEIVSAAAAEVRGFSVTMPGKPEALAYADEVTERALAVESANTLVRIDGGWRADCTDIDGAAEAIARHADLPAAPRVVVLGAGGTSRPFLAALARIGAAHVVVATRRPTTGPALACAARLGLPASDVRLADPAAAEIVAGADLVVNTVPAGGAEALVGLVAPTPRLVDALYDPWPTPLAAAVEARGGAVVGGDVMLLGQALGQFRQFTGVEPPREAMAEALRVALAGRLPEV